MPRCTTRLFAPAPRHRRLAIENLETRALLSVTVPGTLNRPSDPVVLTGVDVPPLAGIAPDDLVAFRDTGSGWQQVPVQVDERALVTMYQIYGQTISHPNLTILTYTDANTWVGPDPDATLDADDEIAFMAKDTGGRVPGFQAAPANVDPASKLEIRVSDPVDAGNAGWVYLFRRTSGAITPGAGVNYVDYQFHLLVGNGDYKTNYDTLSGPNPENSTLETAYYGRRFIERWVTDDLRIKSGTGVDLLDRHKFQFAPGVGTRTEDTFSAGEGAFIINKSGPVRALRSWVGANSGPYTQREEVYYEQREDVITYLRVHAIPAGMDLFDYTSAASGMTYYNDLNTAGVPVDGNPDTVTAGAMQWELLTGAQGSLSQSHVLNTNLPGYTVTSYYLDDTTPPSSDQQVSGDSEAWGQSGPWIQNLASTDVGSSYFFTSRRAMYYSGPGATVATAARNDSLVRSPLEGAIDASPSPSSSVAGRHLFYNQSAFDGNNAAIGAADTSAIAPDKSAYLPGSGQAVLANLSNFDKGLTGIMVDLAGLGDHASITAGDFIFKVGDNNAPGGWATAPSPSALSVSLGAGVGGSDRVTITWTAGAIANKWLEVQVLAGSNTGLAAPDVHFWGNLVGETASTTPAGSFARTISADGGAIITNGTQAAVGITNPLDVNKSNSITVAADRGPIVTLGTGTLTRISIGAGGPFAPETTTSDHDAGAPSAVASALSRTSSAVAPESAQASYAVAPPDETRAASVARDPLQPQAAASIRARVLLTVADDLTDWLLADDDLLARLIPRSSPHAR